MPRKNPLGSHSRVDWFAGLLAFLVLLFLTGGSSVQAGEEEKGKEKPNPNWQAALHAQEPCRILIVGFNGSFETLNNGATGIVKLRDRLNTPEYPGVCFRNFLPYSWPRAETWVVSYFPNHGGRFSREEVDGSPPVIIVGHSLGGMATLFLARLLGGRGIPVELTVQIASFGLGDLTVPSNVRNAANFYVNDPIGVWTKRHIRVKDPNATHFYGNIRLSGYGHISITRAPQVSDLILSTVHSLLAAAPAPAPAPSGSSPH